MSPPRPLLSPEALPLVRAPHSSPPALPSTGPAGGSVPSPTVSSSSSTTKSANSSCAGTQGVRGLGKAAKGGGGQQGLRQLVPGSPRPAGWLCRPVPTLLSLPISLGLRSVFSRVSVCGFLVSLPLCPSLCWAARLACLSPSLTLSLSFLLCLSRLGGEGNLLLTSAPPHRPSLPCPPSPGPPLPVPPILYSAGRSPLSPWPHLGPHPLHYLLTPLLWLASLPCPLPLSSLFSVSVSLPFLTPLSIPPAPATSLGSFLLPFSPSADAVSGSGQLSNISVGREKQCVCRACFLDRDCGRDGQDGIPSAGARCQAILKTSGT